MDKWEYFYDLSKFVAGIGMTFMLFGLGQSGWLGKDTYRLYFLFGIIATAIALIMIGYLNKKGAPHLDKRSHAR